eukprot:CAMPEP_0195306546 /NCGR_PEP_ID=MMETSP0707-20130614/37253_1 /TAXON_ID=33640 /ORGANISM="Asterionellopsis glacialis, Strain CCMP134" /LENGTH=789 /DNA_ID=CAMNT_0040370765 /DNA_START=30 /DNA_END=2400 /DNA_ORIENTATION=-
MDGRYPFDSPGGQRHQQQQAQLQAALEMEEALYLQRQHELQRDLQIRQMLLQDQLDQQMLQQQRMYEIQNYSQHPALAALQQEEMLIQEQVVINSCRELQLSAALQSPGRRNIPNGTATDTFNSEAVGPQQAQQQQQQSSARPQPTTSAPQPPQPQTQASRKRAMSQEDVSAEGRQRARKNLKKIAKNDPVTLSDLADILPDSATKNLKLAIKAKTPRNPENGPTEEDEPKIPAVEPPEIELTEKDKKDIEEAAKLLGVVRIEHQSSVQDLAEVAEAEQKANQGATALLCFKEVEWSDSESEDEDGAISITLGRFRSKLPRLPNEPEYEVSAKEDSKKDISPDKSSTNESHKRRSDFASGSSSKPTTKRLSNEEIYPFPLDTWWPSNSTIRREKHVKGEAHHDEETADEPVLANEESLFRGDLQSIRKRLQKSVDPGVLEKLPHCKLHQLRHKHQKGGKAEPPVFCFQVTETTCNDVMVCCSICSSWRHAACGGHYKPYTIQDQLDSKEPFTPICDRCHEEEQLIREFPKAEARIDRQRNEQLRRALITSSVIRQASFSKHGGTYKWPLGSVSATHIGGHTRSVHSRHDKAERQWAEMAVRLGRGLGYRPKERVKVRTRELERLLVSVEDSEGIMDRHNMLLFLQQDTARNQPVGFDRSRRNIFDPEDDEVDVDPLSSSSGSNGGIDNDLDKESNGGNGIAGATMDTAASTTSTASTAAASGAHNMDYMAKRTHYESVSKLCCARRGCHKRVRFDSSFCSDACGLSALEYDLLGAMQFGGDIHPSLLRS